MGLSNREGTATFHECPKEVGSSTYSEEQAEVLRRHGYELVEHSIPFTTLARICERHAGRARLTRATFPPWGATTCAWEWLTI
jgi:hypothetical protein